MPSILIYTSRSLNHHWHENIIGWCGSALFHLVEQSSFCVWCVFIFIFGFKAVHSSNLFPNSQPVYSLEKCSSRKEHVITEGRLRS